MTPTWGLISLQEWLTELRETLRFTSLLKDLTKDTDKQPDEEIRRVRFGRVLSPGASVPVRLGCIILLVCGCVCQPEPRTSGNSKKALSRRHDQSLLCFQPFSLLKRMGGASLVAQWLRICLPMQGTRVRALVWEDPTCRGATRPVSHNY